jgi:hypothetical protein
MDRFSHRLDKARPRPEAAHALLERALPRQDQAVGRCDHVRVFADADI